MVFIRRSIWRLYFFLALAISVPADASLWLNQQTGAPTARGLELRAALDRADGHAIDTQPMRFKLSQAANLVEVNAAYEAVFDQLIHAFAQGQIDPKIDRLWAHPRPEIEISGLRSELLAQDDLTLALEALAPQHTDYQALLSLYQGLFALDETMPSAVALFELMRPGVADPSVDLVRQRLVWLGYPAEDATTALAPELYDELMAIAIQQFQADHGLKQDRIIGADTLRWLNLTAAQRRQQIAAVLERWRWLPRQLGEEYILATVPGFEVRHIRSYGELIKSYPSISGRPSRPSYSFATQVEQIVANPNWTVPRTILRRDIIPKIHQNSNYLSSQNMHVEQLTDAGWTWVDANVIDWSNTDASQEKLRVVQAPGELNALGKVKFHMPNPFTIYIHDTPHRELFDKPERAFSSGCIRVDQVVDLAAILVGAERLAEALAQPNTRWLRLERPLPIYIVYLTAWPDEQGRIQMREDIYNADKLITKKRE